jgi:hypothetical protein
MTVQIAIGRSSGKSASLKSGLQIMDAAPYWSETITASGSSQATTNAAPDRGEYSLVWDVWNGGDAAVWLTFGATPTAAAGTTWLVPAGQGRAFLAKPGQKAAVVNA